MTAVLMAARTAAAVNPNKKTIPGCSPMESNPVLF
jgi:hypothetical protein